MASQQKQQLDPTKIDCRCGHEDCDAILHKKLTGEPTYADAINDHDSVDAAKRMTEELTSELPKGKQVRRVFFSPHPDDVAYSCFGLVSMTSEQATAFHEDRTSSATGSTSSYDSRSSFSSTSSSSSSSSSSASSSRRSSCSHESDNDARKHIHHRHRPSTAPSTGPYDEWQESVIVTVFSKSRCSNGAIGTSLAHCVDKTTEMRTREDQLFAKSVGAHLFSLGFSDTSARDEGSRRPDLLLTASPRMSTFTLDVDHPVFARVKKRVRPIVEWAVRCKATIYVPLAVGCHIDHWMTRAAVLSTLIEIEHTSQWSRLREARREMRLSGVDPMHVLRMAEQQTTSAVADDGTAEESTRQQGSHLIFYEDLPYGFIGTDDLVRRTVSHFLPRNVRAQLVPLTDDDWRRKTEAVKRYASQMKSTLLDMLGDHALLLAKRGAQLDPLWHDAPKRWTMAERSWVLEDVCGLTANLVASMTSLSIDERPPASSLSSPLSPRSRTKALPVTFTSPFAPIKEAASDVLLVPPVCVEQNNEPSSPLPPPSPVSPTSTFRLLHLHSTVRPKGRLRRMSTCPPEAFPIPYHRAV